MTFRQALLIATGLGLLARGLRGAGALCLVRGQHTPVRELLGLRCSTCGKAGADYEEMLGQGTGWVSPTRRVFDRRNGGEVSRTEHFEPSSRGTH
jgi:hypothetical protein